jgi:hypothetical protein
MDRFGFAKHMKIKTENQPNGSLKIIIKQNKDTPGVVCCRKLEAGEYNINICGLSKTYGKIRLYIMDVNANKIIEFSDKYILGKTINYKLIVNNVCNYKIGLCSINAKVNDWFVVDRFEIYNVVNNKIDNNHDIKQVVYDKKKVSYYDIINNLHVNNDVKNALYEFNTIDKKNNFVIHHIDKKYEINYLLYNMVTINKLNGSVNNELTIMSYLTKIANVYYNNTLINDFVYDNELDISMLNNQIIKNMTSKTKYYGPKYHGIVYPTRNYHVTFFRCDNSEFLKELFKLIPGNKIFSHNYDENIWKDFYVGFQTECSNFLAKKKLLHKIEDDGTLKYFGNDMIIPNKTFIKYQFLSYYTINPSYNIHQKLNSQFIIGIIGNINTHTNPTFVVECVTKLRNIYPNLNINLIIFASESIVDIPKKNWIQFGCYKKTDYFNILANIDICINTWVNNCIIYSGSNKLLDCVAVNTPIVLPYSYTYAEIVGPDYPLFYSYSDPCNNIYNIINNYINDKSINLSIINKYNQIKMKYNDDIYTKYIYQLQNFDIIQRKQYIIIGMGSGYLNYGGISVNTESLHKYMTTHGFTIFTILMGSKELCDYEYISKNFVHCKNHYVYNFLNKFDVAGADIILQSWVPPDVLKYLNKHKCNILFFNPGFLLDNFDDFLLNNTDLKNLKYSDVTLNTINNSKITCVNSKLSYDLITKFTISKLQLYYYNAITIPKCDTYNKNKIFDIGFIISNTERKIKNFKLFKEIINYIPNSKIIIIGKNISNYRFNSDNVETHEYMTNLDILNIIKNIKILVNTSFFDSGPTTLFESLNMGTKYICSKNIGGSELLPIDWIVDDYNDVHAWVKCINMNLNKNIFYDTTDYYSKISYGTFTSLLHKLAE